MENLNSKVKAIEEKSSMAFVALLSRLPQPNSSVISHSGYAAENMPLRQIVLCLSELNGRGRFSLVQTPAAQLFGHKPARV